MLINIVFRCLMFYWLIQVVLPIFITLDFSHSLILIILVYIGGICTFYLHLALVSMIFLSAPPFFTLLISFYYLSDDG